MIARIIKIITIISAVMVIIAYSWYNMNCNTYAAFIVSGVVLHNIADHQRDIMGYKRKYYDKEYVVQNVKGHRFVKGEGIIIGIRKYNCLPDLSSMYNARFEKITIYISGYKYKNINNIMQGGNANVLMFYSDGKVHYPTKGGCIGYSTGSDIQISKLGKGRFNIKADNVFILWPTNIGALSNRCGSKRIVIDTVIEEKSVDQLNVWDGYYIDSPGKEITNNEVTPY